MEKNHDTKIKELEQKIHRLQKDKRKLEREKKESERKKRDHVMIVVGSTLLTHYPEEVKERLLNANDEEIKTWVHGLFSRN